MIKQVTISESNWHYKLVKWVFRIDPKMFNNFCPYFWLVIAGIFLILPVSIFRAISNPVRKFVRSWKQKSYDKFLRSLSGVQVYALHEGIGYNVKYFEPAFSSPYENKKQIVKDYLKINKIELYDLYRNNHMEYQRILIEDKEKKDLEKKKMMKISSATKEISKYLLMILSVFIGFVITNMIITVGFISGALSDCDWMFIFLFFSSIALVTILPKAAIDLWEKRKQLWWVQYIYAIPIWIITSPVWLSRGITKMIGRIFVAIWNGFKEGIIEFGGIFGEYLGSSYSDYCPGINWNNKNEEDK